MEYIPDIGDIIILTIDPTLGYEQRGRRPCLVISHRKLNKFGKVVIICPITNKIKGYPTEVYLPESGIISGAILTNHLRSFDWTQRNIKFIEKCSDNVTKKVLQKVSIGLGIDLYFPMIKNNFE